MTSVMGMATAAIEIYNSYDYGGSDSQHWCYDGEEIQGRSSMFYHSTIHSIQTFRWIGFGAANTTGGEVSSIE
jgi:hypothetical protein